jgi:hypothetical protein
MLAGHRGTQIIYSAAAGRLGVSPYDVPSLGYEHCDAHLCRLRLSLDAALAGADEQAEVAPGSRCLRRSALSRAVSFTDLFTNGVLAGGFTVHHGLARCGRFDLG